MSKLISSADPRLHSQNIQRMLAEVTVHLQYDIMLVDSPRFEALLETTREVLKGLRKAYEDFDLGQGKAWGGGAPPR
jgi:hypothetical protein